MIKFTIIIPTYNAEEYIESTLESVYSQTYKNYEIIVIDDCSTDGTYEMLKKKSNIKLLKTSINSRQGTARNIGLDNCTGDYVLFLDSDDKFFDSNVLEEFKNKILQEGNPDIIFTGLKMVGDRDLEIIPDETNTEKSIRLGKYKWINVTTLCIKNELLQLNNIRFPEKIRYEDVYFAFLVIEKAKSVSYINKITYLYNSRQGSTTSSYSFEQAKDTVLLIKELTELKNKIDKKNIPFLQERIEEQTQRLLVRIQRAVEVNMKKTDIL